MEVMPKLGRILQINRSCSTRNLQVRMHGRTVDPKKLVRNKSHKILSLKSLAGKAQIFLTYHFILSFPWLT